MSWSVFIVILEEYSTSIETALGANETILASHNILYANTLNAVAVSTQDTLTHMQSMSSTICWRWKYDQNCTHNHFFSPVVLWWYEPLTMYAILADEFLILLLLCFFSFLPEAFNYRHRSLSLSFSPTSLSPSLFYLCLPLFLSLCSRITYFTFPHSIFHFE